MFTQSTLIKKAGNLWRQATTAPFLNAIADGTLPREALNRWMVQDYHFADALTSFQAVTLAKTPRRFREPLLGGLVAMDMEMDWFERQASRRRLELEAPLHPVCRHYCDFLLRVAYSEPYQVALAVLFGVEASYLAAWSRLKPAGRYKEFIDRWSNKRFIAYVNSLWMLAEENPHKTNQRHFNLVLEHECEFWRMAWEG